MQESHVLWIFWAVFIISAALILWHFSRKKK